MLALAVKYLFYEDWEENFRIRKTYLEELERKFDEASESDSVSVDTNTSERYWDFHVTSLNKSLIL